MEHTDDLTLLFSQLQRTSDAIRSELEARIKVINHAALVSETDRFGTITLANDLFCQVSGYSRDELIGKPHNIVRHPDMPKEVFLNMWQTIKGGKIFQGVVKNRRKNGTAYWVNATIVPVLDLQGKPFKYIGVRFDISEQIEQQEKINHLLKDVKQSNYELQMHQEELMQNLEEITTIQSQLEENYKESERIRQELDARVGVLNRAALVSETDRFGTITFVNDKFCEVAGYSREELMGKPHNIVRHPDTSSELFREMWQTIKAGKIFQGTIKNRRKDGNPYWVQVTVSPVLDEYSQPVKYIGVRFDISEQIKQQESILKLLREAEETNKTLKQNEKKLQHKKQIQDSINYARRIQQALLPDIGLLKEHFKDSFIYYQPKDVVSGDFYWFYANTNYAIVAAIDCTGRGVPGAFMSVMANNIMNEIVIEKRNTNPDVILNLLQHKVIKTLRQEESDGSLHDGMDIALSVIDHRSQILSFAGAKRPLYWTRKGELYEIKGDPTPIGGARFLHKVFNKHSINIQTADRFYLASDGFQDQFGQKSTRRFGSARFKALLSECQHMSMTQQREHIGSTMRNWQQNQKQIDDMLIIGFEL